MFTGPNGGIYALRKDLIRDFNSSAALTGDLMAPHAIKNVPSEKILHKTIKLNEILA